LRAGDPVIPRGRERRLLDARGCCWVCCTRSHGELVLSGISSSARNRWFLVCGLVLDRNDHQPSFICAGPEQWGSDGHAMAGWTDEPTDLHPRWSLICQDAQETVA